MNKVEGYLKPEEAWNVVRLAGKEKEVRIAIRDYCLCWLHLPKVAQEIGLDAKVLEMAGKWVDIYDAMRLGNDV